MMEDYIDSDELLTPHMLAKTRAEFQREVSELVARGYVHFMLEQYDVLNGSPRVCKANR